MVESIIKRLIGIKYFNQWIVFSMDLFLSTVSTLIAWLILNSIFVLNNSSFASSTCRF